MVDRITQIASEMFDLMVELRSPRDAANAIALANTMLIENATNHEIKTEEGVRAMMAEMTEAVLNNWRIRKGVAS